MIMEKTIYDVKKQVEKVDSDVNDGLIGYEFVGRGWEGKSDDPISTFALLSSRN